MSEEYIRAMFGDFINHDWTDEVSPPALPSDIADPAPPENAVPEEKALHEAAPEDAPPPAATVARDPSASIEEFPIESESNVQHRPAVDLSGFFAQRDEENAGALVIPKRGYMDNDDCGGAGPPTAVDLTNVVSADTVSRQELFNKVDQHASFESLGCFSMAGSLSRVMCVVCR